MILKHQISHASQIYPIVPIAKCKYHTPVIINTVSATIASSYFKIYLLRGNNKYQNVCKGTLLIFYSVKLQTICLELIKDTTGTIIKHAYPQWVHAQSVN